MWQLLVCFHSLLYKSALIHSISILSYSTEAIMKLKILGQHANSKILTSSILVLGVFTGVIYGLISTVEVYMSVYWGCLCHIKALRLLPFLDIFMILCISCYKNCFRLAFNITGAICLQIKPKPLPVPKGESWLRPPAPHPLGIRAPAPDHGDGKGCFWLVRPGGGRGRWELFRLVLQDLLCPIGSGGQLDLKSENLATNNNSHVSDQRLKFFIANLLWLF